ncbi:MAG: hypothetical protein GC168_00520 [Candidatus Hydrogenedens sp.]|nr:hypothetical protein [Candidatus Hydrogenedens sp.]
MRILGTILGLAVVAAALIPAPRADAALSAEVLASATGWEVMSFDGSGGVAKVDGLELSFEVFETRGFEVEGAPWVVSVVRFPSGEINRDDLMTVLRTGECGSSRPPVLVAARTDGSEAYARMIDEDIAATDKVLGLEYGDFLGSGSELSLRITVEYCRGGEKESMTAGRHFVFGFPELTPLAALTAYLQVRTPEVLKQWRGNISQSTKGGRPALVYEGNPITADSPESERLRRPDTSRAEAVIPLTDEESPDTFQGRIVDEEGQPLADIPVEIASKRSGFMVVLGSVYTDTVYTDPEGRFEAPTGNGLQIHVEQEGYYELQEQFHPAKYNNLLKGMSSHEVTEGVTDLVLEREMGKVPVWTSGKPVVKEFAPAGKQVSMGLKFYPTWEESMSSNPIDVLVLADIVIEARRLCPPESPEALADTCEWEVVVRGQNGWELVPDKRQVHSIVVKRAEKDGYKPRWVFTNQTLPNALHLRKDGGERYGIIDGPRFHTYYLGDQTTPSDNEVRISCSYVVQAENVHSRSLVHERKIYVEPGFYTARDM